MASGAGTPTREHERRAGTRQTGLGAVLLVVGVVLAAVLVTSGANTAAAWGYVLVVAGVLLVGNGMVVRRKRPSARRSR